MTSDHSGKILDSRVRVPSHVVSRSFEGETLLLNVDSGEYHGLNETGGKLLALLPEAHGAPAEAIGRLAGEYDVELERLTQDMAAFLLELAKRGLVEVDGPDGSATGLQ